MSLNNKLEQAAAALLAGQDLPGTFTIYAGEANLDKSPPAILCVAGEDLGEEYPEQTGNYWVDLQIIVRSIAEIDTDGVDPQPAHDALVDAVEDALAASDLFAQLNAAGVADFTAQFQEWHGFGSAIQGDCWESRASLRVNCCNSTL